MQRNEKNGKVLLGLVLRVLIVLGVLRVATAAAFDAFASQLVQKKTIS